MSPDLLGHEHARTQHDGIGTHGERRRELAAMAEAAAHGKGQAQRLGRERDLDHAAYELQARMAAALGPDAVPVAEVVRALRATYTERAVRQGDATLHATLVAYQVFGHPRLRLHRATTTAPDAAVPD